MFINRILNYLMSFKITVASLKRFLAEVSKDTGKYVLVVSHALNEGGAPLVLWEAVQLLNQQGYQVVIVSHKNGELFYRGKEEGIYVYPFLRFKKFFRIFLSHFQWKAALINTILCYEWVMDLKTDLNKIWWIHEGKSYFEKVETKLPQNLPKNVSTYFVSEWTAACLKNIGINYKGNILYYGIKDDYTKERENKTIRDKINILFIGAVCKRKCQVLFLEAIEQLDDEIKKKCNFMIVGKAIKGEEEYYDLFIKKLETMGGIIQYIKHVPHDKIKDLYINNDVLVCCSSDDPLPVVVTEAFMHKKCVILSSATGQFPLIENGTSGFTFEAGNVDDLAETISLVCKSKEKLDDIGAKGRIIYEQYFALSKFREALKTDLENVIV